MAYTPFEDQEAPIKRPASEGGWHQGVYKVRNAGKYMSTKPPVFRSSWEYNIMYMFDTNSNICRWGSEIIEIPYINPIDGNPHRYFADFFAEFKDERGQYKKWVIEVKPLNKLSPPKQKKRTKTWAYQMNEYMINTAKWNAAGGFCAKRGWEFKIFTEEEIKALDRFVPSSR
jgi:hypothetical protein